jgi:uncharacterized cupredoxin-like copper-binding protein
MALHIPRRARLAIAGVAAAAALGGAAVPALAATKVSMKLTDFKITGKSSTKAGKVTFTVRNAATFPHELVVIRTRTKAAKLPVRHGKASEKGTAGKIVVPAGKTKALSLTLQKGHYALICNVGNHYMMGMSKDFTVR